MEKEICIMETEGKCHSDYNYGVECDGINPPKTCPYKLRNKKKT